MARKKTARKSAAKKTGRATSPSKKKTSKTTKKATARARTSTKKSRRSASKKTAGKKTAGKKTAGKKTAGKKTAGKRLTRKKTAKKVATKKTAKKPVAKKTTKTVAPKTSKKTTKKTAAATTTKSKKTTGRKTGRKSSAGAARGRSVVEVAASGQADKEGYVIVNGRRVRMISTKGMTVVKKPRTSAAATAEVDPTKDAPKAIKTKLKKRELDKYFRILLEKRAEIVGDLSALEEQALRSTDGDISHMPIHMADIGSDTFDQDFMLGLAENERERLREIDDALMRIQQGTYGVCQMTGKPIPKARLEAKPWAKYTIEAKRLLEAGWAGG